MRRLNGENHYACNTFSYHSRSRSIFLVFPPSERCRLLLRNTLDRSGACDILVLQCGLTKLTELTAKGSLLQIFSRAEWINYSWKQTYFSALFGAFLHLGWDLTVHYDINLGFPFVNIPNQLVNAQAFSIILQASILMILPAYFIGKRMNKSSPFKKLP